MTPRILRVLVVWATLCAAALSSGLAWADTITYYHNDLLGSPVVATNQSGDVLWRESYRPYGERLILEPGSASNKIWFTSRHENERTELIYMGARFYDPVIGRFMSTDPARFDGQNVHSFNRYAYANNNPYRFLDPDGNQPVPAIVPPGRAISTISTLPLGKPSELQRLRALEGSSSSPVGSFSIPTLDAADALSFMLGGFPAVIGNKLDSLIFSSDENWGKPKTLADHFDRHGKDFGAKSPEDYARQASDFFRRSQNERLPTKIDKDGVIRVYDSKTNTFGSYNADGTTRTLFKPTRGEGYWRAEPGALQ